MTDRRVSEIADLERLSFWENGLLPVVAQHADTVGRSYASELARHYR